MNEYPVEWNGRTFKLHDVTAGDKATFCKWAIRWNGMQQIQTWGDMPAILNPLLADIPALVFWGDRGPSALVAKTLTHPEGDLQLNKILFGDSIQGMSDTDLRAMINAKADEQTRANEKAADAGVKPPFPPVNDYFYAMQQIREESDPKAKTPGTGMDPAGTTVS